MRTVLRELEATGRRNGFDDPAFVLVPMTLEFLARFHALNRTSISIPAAYILGHRVHYLYTGLAFASARHLVMTLLTAPTKGYGCGSNLIYELRLDGRSSIRAFQRQAYPYPARSSGCGAVVNTKMK